MNKQIIAAEVDGSKNSCPDMALEFNIEDGFEYVNNTNSPAKIGELYLITEQAYKYFLSKCTEDELWDLGFLGCSEEHVRVANVSNVQL